jgi:hypothetical protein
MPARLFGLGLQDEPVEAVSRQGQHIGKIADRRERGSTGEFDRHGAGIVPQIELNGLRGASEIEHA